jgi:hypothetical protein
MESKSQQKRVEVQKADAPKKETTKGEAVVTHPVTPPPPPTASSPKKQERSTAVDGSEFEVLGVERRGDKMALQVRGEVIVSPSEAEREQYLNTQAGSRMKFDVKPSK